MTFYNLLSNLWTIRIPFHQFLIILNLFTRFFVSRSLYFAARLTLLTPDRTDKMFKKKRILTENMRHVLKNLQIFEGVTGSVSNFNVDFHVCTKFSGRVVRYILLKDTSSA